MPSWYLSHWPQYHPPITKIWLMLHCLPLHLLAWELPPALIGWPWSSARLPEICQIRFCLRSNLHKTTVGEYFNRDFKKVWYFLLKFKKLKGKSFEELSTVNVLERFWNVGSTKHLVRASTSLFAICYEEGNQTAVWDDAVLLLSFVCIYSAIWLVQLLCDREAFFSEFVYNERESRYRTRMDPVSDDS